MTPLSGLPRPPQDPYARHQPARQHLTPQAPNHASRPAHNLGLFPLYHLGLHAQHAAAHAQVQTALRGRLRLGAPAADNPLRE
jgi:hypothetical protein